MTRTSKRWIVRLLGGLVATAALNQPTLAEGWLHRPKAIAPGAPCPGCEPAPALPAAPQNTSPISPAPKTMPETPKVEPKVETPEGEPRIDPFISAATGDSSTAVSDSGSGTFVNMFGDQFRSGSGRSSVVVLGPGVLNGTPGSATFFGATKDPIKNVYNYSGANPGTGAAVTIGGVNSPRIATPGLSFSQAYNPATFQIPPGEVTKGVAVINQLIGSPNSQAFQLANVFEGGKLVSLAIVNASGQIVGIVPPPENTGNIQYNGFLQTTVANQVFINIPNPAGGGVVGRSKMSEDANPLPRDRFIFNYDYFNNTVLTPNGFDVQRFAVGIEKTFLDARASLEVRLPFASTLDSTGGIGTQSRNTELGNLRITPRFLPYRSDTFYVGTGVGISLPTADDTRVVGANGADFVRIQNDSVILSPYIGTLWMPNDRFFTQAWVAFDFDTAGNPVSINPNGAGMQGIGRIYDSTLMQWDLQIGYWILNPQDSNRWFQALAPFGELHYGSSINNPTNVASNGFVIGDTGGRIDELNASFGLTSIVAQQMLVSVGGVVPLSNHDNRSFDYQVGVRVNYFFGPTAAARRLATYVP